MTDRPHGWTQEHDDVLAAAVHMVGRTGARNLQFGYANEAASRVVDADWWASAQYRGARVIVEHYPDPLAALDALVRRLLQGARCKCGRVVTLYQHWATVGDKEVLHGFGFWSAEAQVRAGACQWSRKGTRWQSSCNADPIPIQER